jgi:Fic family protein
MLESLLAKLETKRNELDQLRPISPDNMKIIKDKLSLDFNYYSNNIEGGTLTIGETNSLINLGINATIAKRQRDIQEMQGHIRVIDQLDFFKEKYNLENIPAPLSLKFIKELHQMIFVEDKIISFDNNGITSSTKLPAGQFKLHQNSVLKSDGGIFEYPSPDQVQSLMTDLVDWYNESRDKLNPVVLSAMFHYKFIRIHPFGDGNGRMARLLMNYILQSSGYSIVVITTEDKVNYLNSLELTDNKFTSKEYSISVDVEDFQPFVNYILELEISYLELIINGAKGELYLGVDDIIKRTEIESDTKKYESDFQIELNSRQAKQAQYQHELIKEKITKLLEVLEFKVKSYIKIDNFLPEVRVYESKSACLCAIFENSNLDYVVYIFQDTVEFINNYAGKEVFPVMASSESLMGGYLKIKQSFDYVDKNIDRKLVTFVEEIIKNVREYDNIQKANNPRNT